MADLDIPIAIRRPRRSHVGVAHHADMVMPKTPQKERKTVRFSDPGPSLAQSAGPSSGLTPMIRRTSIATPRRRRADSTPARGATPGARASVTVPSLHQTADGRVERRIRRGNLRELLNKLEVQKKRSAKLAQAEIHHLKSELKARDQEICQLQQANAVIDTERMLELRQQIEGLERTSATCTPHNQTSRGYDWTLAARDPFADDFMDLPQDDVRREHAVEGQVLVSHASRNKPYHSRHTVPQTPVSTPAFHAGVQACLPDPDKQQLEDELASLEREVAKLTRTLDSYKSLGQRIAGRLSSVVPAAAADDAAGTWPLEPLERQVEFLVQTMSDRTVALAHLNSSIADLGFPGTDSSDMITALASGLRAARLELEYLTPGEIALPLTSHGAQVLDLLLTRLRELVNKIQGNEAVIDEYHEIEQSLRQQLDARVSVMDGLKAEMSKAEGLINEKNVRIQELQIGSDRLRGAVDSYIRDISELERLVERMEQQDKDAQAAHQVQRQSDGEALAARDASIAELEERLADAMRQTANLQKEMSDVQDSTTRHVVSLNKQHGAALALGDARVLELRSEMDRVNESLRAAHEMIRVLRVQNSGLTTQMEEERHKAKAAMDIMKEELERVLQMSQEFLQGPRGDVDARDAGAKNCPPGKPKPVVQQGGYLAADLARRGSNKMRRRYDSGMGLLEEDEADM